MFIALPRVVLKGVSLLWKLNRAVWVTKPSHGLRAQAFGRKLRRRKPVWPMPLRPIDEAEKSVEIEARLAKAIRGNVSASNAATVKAMSVDDKGMEVSGAKVGREPSVCMSSNRKPWLVVFAALMGRATEFCASVSRQKNS